MGCRYDGPSGPSEFEVAMSRVFCCLDELDGRPWDRESWRGYHPQVRKMDRWDEQLLHSKTAELCSRLLGMETSKYSLELQIWWRDHQAADRARVEKERREEEQRQKVAAAKAKLTPEDLKVLGLKP